MARSPISSLSSFMAGAILVALINACTSAQEAVPAAAPPSSSGDLPPTDPGSPTGGETGSETTGSQSDASADAPASNNNNNNTTAPGDILGTLSGSCGLVKTLLAAATPSLVQDSLLFVSGEKYEKASLSTDAQRMFDTPNAGGSSVESEVMSLEVLRACEGAKLLKTETEIAYVPPDSTGPSTITDLEVEIDGKKVGVSVTRAYRPASQPFPDSDVKALIQKKLEGVNRSSVRVLPQDKWVKQILHVFASNKVEADAVVRVLPTIDAAIRADTIVLLTQTTGGGFVYCNPDPPLGSECP